MTSPVDDLRSAVGRLAQTAAAVQAASREVAARRDAAAQEATRLEEVADGAAGGTGQGAP